MKVDTGQIICGCGHKITEHDADGCREWWRFPEVLTDRPCGCRGAWQPDSGDTRRDRWLDAERAAQAVRG